MFTYISETKHSIAIVFTRGGNCTAGDQPARWHCWVRYWRV